MKSAGLDLYRPEARKIGPYLNLEMHLCLFFNEINIRGEEEISYRQTSNDTPSAAGVSLACFE